MLPIPNLIQFNQEGNCTKDHCIFRHLEVGNKKRNVTPCYWET